MTHRFIHIGDLHLGTKPRNAERLAALDQIVSTGFSGEPAVEAWLWPGDLNDARMTIGDRNELAARLQQMASIAPVVICYGNHDAPGDLDVFARLKTRFPIYVVDTPLVLRLQLRSGAVAAIFVLPYPMKAGLVAAGVAHQDLSAAAREALEAIFHVAGDEIRQARARGEMPMMIGHVNVRGSVMSSGQPNIGQELEVDEGLLSLLGAGYKGLNHIHKAQEICGAFYAGSCCRLDWGETEDKIFREITYTWEPNRFIYDVNDIPLNVAPMYHVEATLSRESGFSWTVRKGPGGALVDPPMVPCPSEAPHVTIGSPAFVREEDGEPVVCSLCKGLNFVPCWKGCEVRVTYTFPASEKSVLSTAVIHAEFADAKRLELQPVAVPDRALRAPEVAAAVTLQDKFAEYCKLGGSAATPGMLEKLALLEHKDAGTVLSLVAATLADLESEEEAVPA